MASFMAPPLPNGLISRNTNSFAVGSCHNGICGFQSHGLVNPVLQRRTSKVSHKICARLTVDADVEVYKSPRWTEFEMGLKPVFWETENGKPPASGQSLTIFYNPSSTKLFPNIEYGIAFNGGFNQPIMCGGEPRIMSRRERGPECAPLFSIKINVPLHAMTLEFSFTDGNQWDGPYKIKFEVPKQWRNNPPVFFNEGLAKELSQVGACENAIFPDSVYLQDRCAFPASLIHEGGNRCDLDIVPGCTDPENPFYNPLATVDDGSCPFLPDESSDDE